MFTFFFTMIMLAIFLIAGLAVVFGAAVHKNQQTIHEKELTQEERTHYWCSACESYHVDPETKEEHQSLRCKKPWID